MANKKAFIVGINKYLQRGNDLRGCVNDAENVYHALIDLYKFNPDNIRVLTDARATKNAILERLNWLVKDTQPGDELVFHCSSHGSQIRDRDGDELGDGLDEILIPFDLDWNNPLKDDDLAAIFKQVTEGANLTMICDTCHSATMNRELLPPGCGCEKDNHVYKKPRFISPPFDIACRSIGRDLSVHVVGSKGAIEEPQRHVLIAGCRDDQTSADAYINRKYQGALTWALTSLIRTTPNITWNQVIEIVRNELSNNGYSQVPQLSGNDENLNRPVFGYNN
jgi:hypothetical protein